MDKKIKTWILFLMVYVLVFWVGFRGGEFYNRMSKGYTAEKVVVPASEVFYVIEERDYGTYSYSDFRQCYSNDTLIQFLSNEKLKPLLKLKKVQIYNSKGDRIY